jgi:hypothetical protein
VLVLLAGVYLVAAHAQSYRDKELPLVRQWVGQEVVFLPVQRNYNGMISESKLRTTDRKADMKAEAYVGKRGKVVGLTEYTDIFPRIDVVVAIDGSEERVGVTEPYDVLGFVSEYALASRLVGTTLYNLGDAFELQAPTSPWDNVYRDPLFQPLTRLQVTGVSWGNNLAPILIGLRAADGREAQLRLATSRHCIRRDLHFIGFTPACSEDWSVSSDFLTDVPEKLFPKWSADIWKLVRSGQVAVGMTSDQVRLTCGRRAVESTGFVVANGVSSSTHTCGILGRKFLMRNGLVTGYAQ